MTMTTTIGSRVRPCFNAKLSDARTAPALVPARLGRVFVVDAIAGGAVRINGNCWCKSWVRVSPVASEEAQWQEHCAKIARDYPVRYKPAPPWP